MNIRKRILKKFEEREGVNYKKYKEDLILKRFKKIVKKYGEEIYIKALENGVVPSHIDEKDKKFIERITKRKLRIEKTNKDRIIKRYGEEFYKSLVEFHENPMFEYKNALELSGIQLKKATFFHLYRRAFGSYKISYGNCYRLIRTDRNIKASRVLLEAVSKVSKYGKVEKDLCFKRTFICNKIVFYVGVYNQRNKFVRVNYSDELGLDVVIFKHKGLFKGIYISELLPKIKIKEEEMLTLKEIFSNDI